MNRLTIGITMGDPAGIGPEIVLKALGTRHDFHGRCIPVVIGDGRVLERTAQTLNISGIAINAIAEPGKARGEAGIIDLIDLRNADPDSFELGEVSALAGAASVEYVKRATALAMAGSTGAVITAPINKKAINRSGCPYPGHTELLAELTGTEDVGMLLVGPQLRVIHVSTHLSLREACDRVKRDRVLTVIRLADQNGRWLGFERPRVAVAGLNPHAGESGLFGDEEQREIVPAIEAAKAEGIEATGPWPPDTVFLRAVKGAFDVIVAMYHDQGHIPMKLLAFDEGVNVSVGLPIIRTSVDHGTAFDIVGQGVASERSLIAAIEVAVQMAESRAREKGART
jgi:4-hydroxythreonine-4-phosphate dehydrogenase